MGGHRVISIVKSTGFDDKHKQVVVCLDPYIKQSLTKTSENRPVSLEEEKVGFRCQDTGEVLIWLPVSARFFLYTIILIGHVCAFTSEHVHRASASLEQIRIAEATRAPAGNCHATKRE